MSNIANEKRYNFRVRINNALEGKVKLVSIGGRTFEADKDIYLILMDISVGGMKIRTSLDIPMKTKIIVEVSFELGNKKFKQQGRLVWKNEKNGNKEYGIQFVNLSEKEERNLIRCLNDYQLKKAKHKENKTKLKKRKGMESIYKMLEALPYPAYLITMKYEVIGANKLAFDASYPLGEKCYREIGRKNDVCSFCKVEEATISNEIISGEHCFGEEKLKAYWLYLEKDVFLHYFKRFET